jgi:hypothetical protein
MHLDILNNPTSGHRLPTAAGVVMSSASTREVRCVKCNTVNRVQAYSFRQIPRCGRCHVRLPESFLLHVLRDIAALPRVLGFYAAIMLVLVCVCYLLAWADRPSLLISDPCAGRPQPPQGVYRWYTESPDIAPLTIRTAAGSNYFVKLVSRGGDPVRSFFVYGDSQTTNNVPLGSYVVKYAAGQTWCNERDLFGEGSATSTNQADKVFTFERSVQNDWNGITTTTSAIIIELIRQRGGNLATHRIDRSQF